MARRRTTATTASSHRKTPLPGQVLNVRRIPRTIPRPNYYEKGNRSSSSRGSTARSRNKPAYLKITLSATLVNNFGETEFCGNGVFTLTEKAHRSSLHARTRELFAEVLGAATSNNPVAPVSDLPAPEFLSSHIKYQEYKRKAEENAKVILQAEAEVAAIRAARHARDLAEARAGKRKVGEPSEPTPKARSPCSGEREALMTAVKEEEESEDTSPHPQMRTFSGTTPPSGAPSGPN